MIKSSNSEDILRIGLNIIPVYTLLGTKHVFALPDISYGEYVILNASGPRYYFNMFDKEYDSVREQLGHKDSIDVFLDTALKKSHSKLYIKQKLIGFHRYSLERLEEYDLEKLPLTILIDLLK